MFEHQLILILGVLSMLILAVGMIFFVILYQRRIITHQAELKKINEQKELELLRAAIESEERERMRIASELHDDVNSTLASARLFLYKEKEAQFDDRVISQAKELLDASILKIRNISHKLQPATLQHLGLEMSLQSMIDVLGMTNALKAQHIISKRLPRLAENIELAAYRICQEIIANIIKHSGADLLVLETYTTTEHVALLFTHDGMGLTQAEYESLIYKKGATGLKNIVNRLKSVNATILFYTADGKSYNTLLLLPFTNEINN